MAIDKQVLRKGPFQQFIPEAVKVGNIVYLSGQISVDDEGNVLHPGDFVAQARQSYVHIKSILAEFGATMDNVVDELMFVTDMDTVMGDLEGFAAVRAEAYGGDPDVTQALIQVAGLVFPDLVVEIKCVAHL